MKHRDARVSAMCQKLRAAIDLWEEIQMYPFKKEEREPPPTPPVLPPSPSIELPPEKLAYSIKGAALALGIGRTTLWRAIRDGKLAAIKLGNRTLITTDALQAWLRAMPAKRSG